MAEIYLAFGKNGVARVVVIEIGVINIVEEFTYYCSVHNCSSIVYYVWQGKSVIITNTCLVLFLDLI